MSDETTAATSGSLAPMGPTKGWPRNLTDLWTGWPVGGPSWAFHELDRPEDLPIKVEEVLDDEQLVIRADLPGVDPDKDIEVTVSDGILSIRAERRVSSEKKLERGYRSEVRYGSFLRHLRLPPGTRPEVVSATYRDGVLEVRLPAPGAESAPARVQIQRG